MQREDALEIYMIADAVENKITTAEELAKLSPEASRGELIAGEFISYRSLKDIRIFTVDDTIDCEELLPGFSVAVKEIFS